MTFKDIKGQEKAIGLIEEYLKAGTLKGAYLFIGEEGVGKYSAASVLAKALNCLNKKNDPCNICSSCLRIEKREHPDVHFILPVDSGAIKIESVRELKKNISLKAYEAKIKVFIINDAHLLTAEASGALLKILEEPLGNSLIILITAKPLLLFKTIVSRCKIIRFHPLKRKALQEILKKTYALDEPSSHFLAYFSEGRIGTALRLKDTDMLTKKNRIIDKFTGAPSNSDYDNIVEAKDELRLALNILASWVRDIYLIRIGLAHAELINSDRLKRLLEIMNRYTSFNLNEMMKSISDSFRYLDENINVKLLISNLRAELWKK